MSYCPECGLDAVSDVCEFCEGAVCEFCGGTGKAPEIGSAYAYPDCTACCGSGVGHADSAL